MPLRAINAACVLTFIAAQCMLFVHDGQALPADSKNPKPFVDISHKHNDQVPVDKTLSVPVISSPGNLDRFPHGVQTHAVNSPLDNSPVASENSPSTDESKSIVYGAQYTRKSFDSPAVSVKSPISNDPKTYINGVHHVGGSPSAADVSAAPTSPQPPVNFNTVVAGGQTHRSHSLPGHHLGNTQEEPTTTTASPAAGPRRNHPPSWGIPSMQYYGTKTTTGRPPTQSTSLESSSSSGSCSGSVSLPKQFSFTCYYSNYLCGQLPDESSKVVKQKQFSVGSKKYYIDTTTKVNWYQAYTNCRQRNMDLATVDSAQEQALLTGMMNSSGVTNLWLSGNDLGEPGKYIWMSTGLPLTFAIWNGGEPNHGKAANGEVEHCVEILSSTLWNDNHCSATFNYACQYYKEEKTAQSSSDVF